MKSPKRKPARKPSAKALPKAEKRRPGNPGHTPTDILRAKVSALVGFGAPQDYIAREIGVSEPTLRAHYRDELDHGMAKANSAVAQALYKKATGDGPQAVTAAIFWAKTRMGWKETTTHELTGKDDGPVVIKIVAAG